MPPNSRLVWTFAGALSILVLISLKTPCGGVKYTGLTRVSCRPYTATKPYSELVQRLQT